MANHRKRKRASDDESDTELAVLAAIPANDLHQPDPNAEDQDREAPGPKRPSGSKSLFVRGLGTNATSETLAEFFSQSYLLKHATVVRDPITKASKGYGFVTLADPDDTARAREELNGARFGGKKIKVDIAEPRQRVIEEDAEQGGAKRSKPAPVALEVRAQRREQREKAQPSSAPPKLIIRNLPFSIQDPDELAQLFRSYGKIKYATIPKTPLGKAAGFGFITLRGKKNAEKALAGVNGKVVDGRILAVDWAVEKEIWEQRLGDGSFNKEKGETDHEDAIPENPDPSLSASDGGIELEDETEPLALTEDDPAEDSKQALNNSDDSVQPMSDNSQTVFVRNLPFSTMDDDLYEHFRAFGPIRYARVVMDQATGYSKGTGFVCFYKKEDAVDCCRKCPQNINPLQKDNQRTSTKPSLLEDIGADTDGRYTLLGRVLNVTRALEKSEAARIQGENKNARDRGEKDKRRLFLLAEGTINTQSALYAVLTPSERKVREESAKQRQDLIKKNPSLHLSLTRLSIRNIPRFVTSKDLKALAREAVVGFATDVKAGRRSGLSKEELARGGDAMKEAEHSRKLKGKGIVKQAKVVFESKEGSKVTERTGGGRSRGYGFIEYSTHRCALMGLRYLNGHLVEPPDSSNQGAANSQDNSKRLVVEFAIENAQVVTRRHEREERSRAIPGRSGFALGGTQVATRKATTTSGTPSIANNGAGSDAMVGQPPSTNITETKETLVDDETAQRNRIIGRKRAKRRRTKVA